MAEVNIGPTPRCMRTVRCANFNGKSRGLLDTSRVIDSNLPTAARNQIEQQSRP
jgi:hypothetical protein